MHNYRGLLNSSAGSVELAAVDEDLAEVEDLVLLVGRAADAHPAAADNAATTINVNLVSLFVFMARIISNC